MFGLLLTLFRFDVDWTDEEEEEDEKEDEEKLVFVLLRFGRRMVARFFRSFEGDFGFNRLALAVSLNGDESSKLERFVGPIFINKATDI